MLGQIPSVSERPRLSPIEIIERVPGRKEALYGLLLPGIIGVYRKNGRQMIPLLMPE